MSMSSSKAEEGGREGVGEGEEEVVEGWWEGPVVEVATENGLLGLEGVWGGRGDWGRGRGGETNERCSQVTKGCTLILRFLIVSRKSIPTNHPAFC